ncbi:CRISPR-associated protein Csx11 [Candidatus Aquicultor secundus]|uniref:CRISPR-associated protein Csx11 n=2 Tax=Candidatus Aquicultor secundus TaxID=1973895 RepID=UPI000CABFDD7|nr:CRISPR-associated protein Csx11 [Candidatus Aquicultor secundus]PIU27638.1 MAG: CRISPR-associated protein Csx11 [Candidatus Aquicultor secundus]
MTDLLKKIETHKEAILLGEVGALLHMFGKASSEFLQANSLKGQGNDSHQDLKHLPNLKPYLEKDRLKDAFSFTVNGKQEKLSGNFTDFILKYKGSQPDSYLLKLFNTCHRMTSADEKGVIRRKQSINNMWITTPFGYRAHKIDPACVDSARADMDQKLADAFDSYLKNEQNSIEHLRKQAVNILQPGLSEALGETRQPANDVTLWAQSHGVASLYKPVLVTLAMEIEPCPKKNGDYDFDQVRWRLLGIGWNGLGFIQRSRKPADILQRQEIVRVITREIQQLIEVKYPLGNLFYWDVNGLFLTFPGIEDNVAQNLVDQFASELVQIVREQSDNELWPFLTLSKPRRTLTIITQEIEHRDKLAALPHVATILSLEKDDLSRGKRLLLNSPELKPPASDQDICPVCQFRGKSISEDACSICMERRSGRQNQGNGQTIWIDEVADANNRIALLTLRFDLSRWLNGEWLTTLLSQNFNDWYASLALLSVLQNPQQKRKLERIISPISATPDVVTDILGQIGTGQVEKDVGFKTSILNTFFTDIKASEEKNNTYYFSNVLNNLRSRIDDNPGYKLTSHGLATAVFTQNPSPARLSRIWQETETFLNMWLANVEEKVFAVQPQRLRFVIKSPIDVVQKGKTYRITIPNLSPGPLVVLCLGKQEFLTIDSLDKFKYEQGESHLSGMEAVKHALQGNGVKSWVDEATGQPLPCDSLTEAQKEKFTMEPYLPYIILSLSPVFCQVLVPADRAPDILRQLLNLFDERFEKVQGKLPLHVGLLVAKRKFPLYALLEAGQRALSDPAIKKGRFMYPWWTTITHTDDPFYGWYPSKKPDKKGHRLVDLSPVNAVQKLWLTPGYFDFDFLGSTADRYRLYYDGNANQGPKRISITYGKLNPRPFPFHYLSKIFKVWDALSIISQTQRHQLEGMLSTKLEEWKTVGGDSMPVFEKFGKALLRDSFGKDWAELSAETKRMLEESLQDGLLLETLQFFQHVIKEGILDERR